MVVGKRQVVGSGTVGTGFGSRAGAVERAGGRITRRITRRIAGTVAAAAVAIGLTPAAAGAAPRRPSDNQIQAAQEQARAVEDRIGQLSGRLSAAQQSVDAARATSAIMLDEYQATQEAAEAARAHADVAVAASAQADAELGGARGDLASFARRSYRDGSSYAGAAALITVGNPGELVERAAVLEAAGSHRTDVLQRVAELKVVADRADVVARTALVEADGLQKHAAATLEIARTAEISARAQAAALRTEQAQLQHELGAAQQELQTLVGDRAAAERAAAVVAAPVPAPRPAPAPAPAPAPGPLPSDGGTGPVPAPVPAPAPTSTRAPAPAGPGSASAAQTAIDAAMAYLGTPYAWGGGGTRGPGVGQDPDSNIAGFDCSGLIQYAYARAGISIPRNSRAQYAALPKVPSDDLRPGDPLSGARTPTTPTRSPTWPCTWAVTGWCRRRRAATP